MSNQWKDYKEYYTNKNKKDKSSVWETNTVQHTGAAFVPGVPRLSFEELVVKTALEAATILIKKHQDYGPDNINNAPGGAINGLLVRMHDKMERLKTLILGKKEPKYESIEDTLTDMLNYSIIALMVQKGQWPK